MFLRSFYLVLTVVVVTLFADTFARQKSSHKRRNKPNWNQVPQHLTHLLDLTCTNPVLVPAPKIKHGEITEYSRSRVFKRSHSGDLKKKSFMVAVYKCNEGYRFRNEDVYMMYCSKRSWIGKKPKCELDADYGTIQNDALDSIKSSQRKRQTLECSAEFRLNCEQRCEVIDGVDTCVCNEGFVMDGESCRDIDECAHNNGECQETCQNTPGSFGCSCSEGWRIGDDLHTCEDINECLLRNGHGPCQDKCENTQGSYICRCDSLNGTHLAEDGHTCTDIDECSNGKAGCSHGCVNTLGRAFCTCPDGMNLGSDWKLCEDINECDDPDISNSCPEGCVNTIGSYECVQKILTTSTATEATNIPIENYREQSGDYEAENDNERDDYEEENYSGDSENSIKEEETTKKDESIINIDEENEVYLEEISTEKEYVTTETTTELEKVETTTTKEVIVPIVGNEEYEEDYKSEDDYGAGNIKEEYSEEYEGITEDATEITTTSMSDISCIVGYEMDGNGACTDIDECENNSHSCSHVCINTPGSYKCACPDGWELLQNNSTFCQDVNECLDNPCSHLCLNEIGTFRCQCPDNHVLINGTTCVKINCSHDYIQFENSYECICPEGYRKTADGISCDDIDECESNNNCTHLCQNSPGSYECGCKEGYDLSEDGFSCYDINECELTNPCSHICINTEGSYECVCPDGFLKNESTQTCTDINECAVEHINNCSQLCINQKGGFTCACETGYELQQDGVTCLDIDECLLQNDVSYNTAPICVQTCTNIVGSYVCGCLTGYSLNQNGFSCDDIDECVNKNGNCSQLCVNRGGSYECRCNAGYELSEDGFTCNLIDLCTINNGNCSHICTFSIDGKAKCSCPKSHRLKNETHCQLEDLCLDNNGGCSHICTFSNEVVTCSCPDDHILLNQTYCTENLCNKNNGNCSHICSYDSNNRVVLCTCPENYVLEGKSCIPIDPCADANNGGCSHICQNNNGSPECSCPTGYVLRPNKKSCKEINECAFQNGGCSHHCRNVPGSYECTCSTGYQLDSTLKNCVDINECLINNGYCEHNCKNYLGSYRCGCNEGYILSSNGRNCEKSMIGECPKLQAPLNGMMKCIEGASNDSSFVPSGTKCVIWCEKGYKLVGNSGQVCDISGNWENSVNYCIPVVCPRLGAVQMGRIIPNTCVDGKTFPGEKCTVQCARGYTPAAPLETFTCQENLRWYPPVSASKLFTACIKSYPQPFIKCPSNGYITSVLPLGQRQMFVQFPRPHSNVDWWRYVSAKPSWAMQLGATLPVGKTDITFYAFSPATNATASCRLAIDVLDKEKPSMSHCPQNIELALYRNELARSVHWQEPQFYDNVGIFSTYRSKEPGTKFSRGVHHVTYVASDLAGNRAYCYFTVTIKDASISNDVSDNLNAHLPARYRAILVCPHGVQYMSNPSEYYDNTLTNTEGCTWRHVRIANPFYVPGYRIRQIHSQSLLPDNVKLRHRQFKWYNRCC